MEYEGNGEMSCCMAGEVMNTVRNRQNEYTVRILHQTAMNRFTVA